MAQQTQLLRTANSPRLAGACGVRAPVAVSARVASRRCVRCRVVSAPVLPEQEAIAGATAAAERAGGWFAPPVTDRPEELLRQNVPFLTTQAGALPVKPRGLDHALQMYGSYTSKYVSVRVENIHVKLSSWDHAVDSLEAAEAARKPYWCSLIEQVQHPAWWPHGGHVPTYDQVIFGRGNASIGLHFDKDNACAGGSRRPVSTYLAICEGRKLTLLLPPDQTLLPPGGDPDLLLNPPAGLLEAVREAGGYYFMLEDLGAGSTGRSTGSSSSNISSSSSSSGDWRSNWRTSSSSSSNGSSSSSGDWRSNWRTSSSNNSVSSSRSSRTSGDWGSSWRTSSSNSSSSSNSAGQEPFSATALYMPSGWYHHLVGLSEWHVVYGGSFYPEQQEWNQHQYCTASHEVRRVPGT